MVMSGTANPVTVGFSNEPQVPKSSRMATERGPARPGLFPANRHARMAFVANSLSIPQKAAHLAPGINGRVHVQFGRQVCQNAAPGFDTDVDAAEMRPEWS